MEEKSFANIYNECMVTFGQELHNTDIEDILSQLRLIKGRCIDEIETQYDEIRNKIL